MTNDPQIAPNPGSVEDRLNRIEARQRDHWMHDPDCPKREADRAQLRTGSYVIPGKCSCWLSESP